MPRTARQIPGGIVFHVLNRGVGRMTLFDKPADYRAFERVLEEMIELVPMRLLSYCVMPNHWHLVLWPREDGDLATFMQRLTITHVRRWQEHRHLVGTGHVYQGRYRSFPVQSDSHFLRVCRYVERNALRAALVDRAESWPWGSLYRCVCGQPARSGMLSRWPIDPPPDWVQAVNRSDEEEELAALRCSAQRGQPFGSPLWQARIVRQLGLESTFRPRGRPRKSP